MNPYAREPLTTWDGSPMPDDVSVDEGYAATQWRTLGPDRDQWARDWPLLAAALTAWITRDTTDTRHRGSHWWRDEVRAVLVNSGYPTTASCITGARQYVLRAATRGEDAELASLLDAAP
jgi:hypothetical protein